jgi:hypothetical protein
VLLAAGQPTHSLRLLSRKYIPNYPYMTDISPSPKNFGNLMPIQLSDPAIHDLEKETLDIQVRILDRMLAYVEAEHTNEIVSYLSGR